MGGAGRRVGPADLDVGKSRTDLQIDEQVQAKAMKE